MSARLFYNEESLSMYGSSWVDRLKAKFIAQDSKEKPFIPRIHKTSDSDLFLFTKKRNDSLSIIELSLDDMLIIKDYIDNLDILDI